MPASVPLGPLTDTFQSIDQYPAVGYNLKVTGQAGILYSLQRHARFSIDLIVMDRGGKNRHRMSFTPLMREEKNKNIMFNNGEWNWGLESYSQSWTEIIAPCHSAVMQNPGTNCTR